MRLHQLFKADAKNEQAVGIFAVRRHFHHRQHIPLCRIIPHDRRRRQLYRRIDGIPQAVKIRGVVFLVFVNIVEIPVRRRLSVRRNNTVRLAVYNQNTVDNVKIVLHSPHLLHRRADLRIGQVAVAFKHAPYRLIFKPVIHPRNRIYFVLHIVEHFVGMVDVELIIHFVVLPDIQPVVEENNHRCQQRGHNKAQNYSQLKNVVQCFFLKHNLTP